MNLRNAALIALAAAFFASLAPSPSLPDRTPTGAVEIAAKGAAAAPEKAAPFSSDSLPAVEQGISLQAQFGVDADDEDHVQMLRVDVQQRSFGIDRAESGPIATSRAARNARPNISPPLLV